MLLLRTKYLATFCCLLMLAASMLLIGCAKTTNGAAASALQADGSLIAKGKVTKISADGLLAIKPPKGEAITLKLTAETKFNGIADAKSIKSGTALEIRYRQEGTENIAISVTAIAQGSC